MLTEEHLQEMQERCASGEALSAAESMELVMRVRKLEWDLANMDEMYNTLCVQTESRRGHLRALGQRLGYVLNQLSREARFKSRHRPEDARFFRGYDALEKVVGELR